MITQPREEGGREGGGGEITQLPPPMYRSRYQPTGSRTEIFTVPACQLSPVKVNLLAAGVSTFGVDSGFAPPRPGSSDVILPLSLASNLKPLASATIASGPGVTRHVGGGLLIT